MKFAVIGGTGRIGSKIVETLAKDGHGALPHARSTGVDRAPDLSYYRAKVLQEELFKTGPVPYSIVRATPTATAEPPSPTTPLAPSPPHPATPSPRKTARTLPPRITTTGSPPDRDLIPADGGAPGVVHGSEPAGGPGLVEGGSPTQGAGLADQRLKCSGRVRRWAERNHLR